MKISQNGRYPCIVKKFLTLTSRDRLREAVDCLPLLSRNGISLNSKMTAFLIQKCADSECLKEGKLVHLHMKLTGNKHPSIFLCNHLINMYAKCGDHIMARQVFDKMHERNLYSWNNMLSGYANLGMVKAAKRLFDRMPERDLVSWNTMVMAFLKSGLLQDALNFYLELRRLQIGYNEHSFAGILIVSVKLKELWLVKQLHCQVLALGFLSNVVISSSVQNAYAKCGVMRDSRRLFDEMNERDILVWTTLVSGYARGGDMELAKEIFDAMPVKNSVSWTTLIAGYAHNGMPRYALNLLTQMMRLNIDPDEFTFSSCFVACASIVSLEVGKQLHSYFITGGIRRNVVVLSSLVDMYSKCGSLELAKRVFDTIVNKQHVILWNSMISSLAYHGCSKQAIKIFIDMVRLGVKPDSVTFLVILEACNHSALVKEGLRLFEFMSCDYSITPDHEHYACLIDLLGRAGYFDEMMNELKMLPYEPNWDALLGICRNHGKLEFGRILSRHLIAQSPVAYLLLSGLYASIGRWETAEQVRQHMRMNQLLVD